MYKCLCLSALRLDFDFRVVFFVHLQIDFSWVFYVRLEFIRLQRRFFFMVLFEFEEVGE